MTANKKQGRVQGQAAIKSKDYFDDYYEQMVSWSYEKGILELTKFGNNFGP